MRFATYNVEWFNALFDDEGALLDDDGPSARYEISRGAQLAAAREVFTALDADAIMVIEAPDTNAKRSSKLALENFAAVCGLRARKAMIGYANQTQQEIALLYDPDKMTCRHDPKEASEAPRFDGNFRIDLDIDDRQDKIAFSKPPLEVAIELQDGFSFRLLGAHLKSKAPHGARSDKEAMRMAIANRRKQQAQAIWLRRRVLAHLEQDEPVMLMGDLNDGPGLDTYEQLFGRSSVEVILGDPDAPDLALFDPHANHALSRRMGAVHTTARFYKKDEKRYLQALLDYIMVSSHFLHKRPSWRIWHPFDDPDCWRRKELSHALLTASDHFPVAMDIDL
ncbi:MAG: endonuclease/exonuclease/phosphatase family protein [Pseudomonadota bacterium]